MTLQSEDMGKLVAGKSVLLLDGELVTFSGIWRSARGRPGIRHHGGSQFAHRYSYVGERTEDGWIEGEWAENPVPGMAVEAQNIGGTIGLAPSQFHDWPNIRRFRPAHSEAQPESDGGGVFRPLMEKLAGEIAEAADTSDATPLERFVAEALASDDAKSKGLVDKVWVVSLPDARKAIAAIAAWNALHPTPEGQTEGALIERLCAAMQDGVAVRRILAALASKGA